MAKFTYRKCVNEKKAEILAFIKTHKKRPDAKSLNAAEKHLGVVCRHYVNPSSGAYDPVFRKTLIKLGYMHPHSPDTKKRAVLAFIKREGHLPRRKAPKRFFDNKYQVEHLCGVWLRRFTDKVAYPSTYDAAFVQEVNRRSSL